MPFIDRQGHVCGFLNYEEIENSGRFSRRYFVISDQDHALLAFFDSPANLPKGSPPTLRVSLSIISNARDVSKQRPKVELCFVITTPERNYYLQADNQEEKDEWISKVNNACKVTVPSKVSKSPTHSSGDGKEEKQLSYRTEIVGGVVMRTPVNQPSGTGSTAVTRAPLNSDTDSDDDHLSDRKSYPSCLPQHQIKDSSSSKYIFEGWCVKQGAVRKNWKRRYFALSEHGVSYFKTETDKLPIRTIATSEIIGCKVSGQWSALQRDNLFEINCLARTFFVQAYSPEEMEEWVEAISKVIHEDKSVDGTKSDVSQTKRPISARLSTLV
ncbi:Pleckstrin-likey domain-containing family A member 1 [Holothuria leucospilota]|uniref:Pleckstrin-likey domain-containing family A member 1 n=1 Tax=Holothuria leucospilota TaxID=206669 RepID=A0A9Q0YNZ2_HOLLE|nr:Pleckstrin-likey domain-containing family A member 1 [Holothuria leucospilota]